MDIGEGIADGAAEIVAEGSLGATEEISLGKDVAGAAHAVSTSKAITINKQNKRLVNILVSFDRLMMRPEGADALPVHSPIGALHPTLVFGLLPISA